VSWKQIAAILSIFIIVIVAYSFLTMPKENAIFKVDKPYSFNLFIQDAALVESDNGNSMRAYVTTDIISSSAKNSSLDILVFGKQTLAGIYEVNDYSYDSEKKQTLSRLKSNLSKYGMPMEGISLSKVMDKQGSVILVPSNAMPHTLASGKLIDLIEGNALIYYGKSLDISIDKSGAQTLLGDNLTELLNISYAGETIVSSYGGPKLTEIGNATVLEYENGWLIIYPESASNLSSEIAQMILHEKWQSNMVKKTFDLSRDYNNTITLFSPEISGERAYPRIIFHSFSDNDSKIGKIDLQPIERLNGSLRIPQISGSLKALPYEFELHDNLTYPMTYSLRLTFAKDGQLIDSVGVSSVTMKTVAVDSGEVKTNITSGSYIVSLVDQFGKVHARAYTRIPEVKMNLFMIDGYDHYFKFTKDGIPASSKKVKLTVNDENDFILYTDKNGEAYLSFGLAPGLYTFEADVDGEVATAYFRKSDDGLDFYLYAFLFFGSILAMGVFALRNKTKKKWYIKTYPRPSSGSKTITIPYEVFLDLFNKTQKDRAKGLPLSVTDIRMGIRKYAKFKGSQVFITDSNIYHILDSLVKKKLFFSYDGYFMPVVMLGGLPIEYWVLKRKLKDYSIESGADISQVKDAEFLVKGKMLHIWGNIDPKKLLKLSKKVDSLIIFPDSSKKDAFLKKAAQYDPQWMRVLLEIRHGKIYCQTLEQFLERGNNGKA
jgi:hypothetical protein